MHPLDQNKKNGKYLSKKSGIIKKVAVMDYNFQEITKQKPVITDNILGSVVFANLHDAEETVSLPMPSRFNDDLANPDTRNPIILAQDFTNDWSKSSLNRNKNYNILDEDEDLDPLQVLRNKQKKKTEADQLSLDQTHKTQDNFKTDQFETQKFNENNTNKSSLGSKLSTQGISKKNLSEEIDPRNPELASIDMMSKVISELKPQGAKRKGQDELGDEQIDVLYAQTRDQNIEMSSPTLRDDFIPMETQNHQATGIEESAMKQYLAQKEMEEIRKKAMEDALTEAKKNINLEKIESEARARGYEAGFREGESKGVMAAQHQKEEVALNIEKIIAEFGNLKFNILENAQENFLELTQAICEVILDENFKVNPESFAKVIQHAISEATQADQFFIYVSPERYESLKDLSIPSFRERLRADKSLQKDDFKIDSDLTAISGNIKQMISELLRKANIKLFDGVG